MQKETLEIESDSTKVNSLLSENRVAFNYDSVLHYADITIEQVQLPSGEKYTKATIKAQETKISAQNSRIARDSTTSSTSHHDRFNHAVEKKKERISGGISFSHFVPIIFIAAFYLFLRHK